LIQSPLLAVEPGRVLTALPVYLAALAVAVAVELPAALVDQAILRQQPRHKVMTVEQVQLLST
jgi:hypothetical protein